MYISYDPLWKLLIDNKMKKTDLITILGISPNTLARLSKCQFINMKTVCRIAIHFHVQISDIVIIADQERIRTHE